jgi:hypothetical protein
VQSLFIFFISHNLTQHYVDFLKDTDSYITRNSINFTIRGISLWNAKKEVGRTYIMQEQMRCTFKISYSKLECKGSRGRPNIKLRVILK